MPIRSTEIHGAIRRRILQGELEPGRRLVIRRIAEEFGCSDIPVREALRGLEADGLVEVLPYRGAQVKVFHPDEVREAYLIRGHLESLATGAAADFVDDDTLAQLQALIEQIDDVLDADDVVAYSRLNREFHEVVFSACPHRRLHDLITKIWDGQVGLVTVLRLKKDRLRRSNDEHRAILDALRRRDGDAAARLALEHKLGVGDDLVAALMAEERRAASTPTDPSAEAQP